MHHRVHRRMVLGMLTSIALVPTSAVRAAADDWDLYMLRLVNRARLDPAGEAARIGSVVFDSTPPRAPLAYLPALGGAATSHNDWMHENLGAIDRAFTPDSFTHYETLDGSSGGAPAVGTPSYTGASLGARISAAGFNWSSAGENIRAAWSTSSIPINQGRIDGNHRGWWESSGHRGNMLSANFTGFGHRAESRSFAPPRGGLSAPIDNLHYATQTFGRPLTHPRTYVLGLLYDDADTSGDWTPREAGHPLREGLGGAPVEIRDRDSGSLIAAGTTMSNGAFSINVGNGVYDVTISAPAGPITLNGIAVDDANVDVGDIEASTVVACDSDVNGDNVVAFEDILAIILAWGPCAGCPEDADGNGAADFGDIFMVIANWGPCTPELAGG